MARTVRCQRASGSIKAAVTPARLSSHRRSPFAVDQHAAQDLAGGRFGDLLDELYGADLLVGSPLTVL